MNGLIFYVSLIENGLAKLEREDGVSGFAFLSELPAGCRENDVLEYTGTGYIIRDDLKTERQKKLSSMLKKLTNKK